MEYTRSPSPRLVDSIFRPIFLRSVPERKPRTEWASQPVAFISSAKVAPLDFSRRAIWLTFVRNHAEAMVACDFFVVFAARFRILYVLVIMELGRRQILHHNVTAHPNAEWTLQQFREALTEEHPYRFLIHDRDSIFSKDLDKAVTARGIRILKTHAQPRTAEPDPRQSRRWLPPAREMASESR